MEITKNAFQSLSMDIAAANVKNTQMLYNANFRVLTRENSNWVLNNIKGNKLVSGLSIGFRPVCIEVYAGIAYIISARFVNGQPTGEGEIGTFPSPDYGNTDNLEMIYRPLRNLRNASGQVGPMRSAAFNFTCRKAFSMAVEEDYDGTANIIWTDGVNPMRIVNSRFTVRDNFTYEIIERTGTKETNIYEEKDFETVINLIAQSSKILNVDFNGLLPGGRLLSGNYRYFFMLETEDGNRTNVLGESGLVSVFMGDTPGNTRGGNSGLETDKMASFEIRNIDESYRFLRTVFVHSTGREEPVERAYMIDQRYPIQNGTVRVTHIGSEQNLPVDIAELNLDSQPVDTVGTLTKAGGYILAGDITEKVIDYKSLISFSRKISASPIVGQLQTYGLTDNGADLNTRNDQRSKLSGTDGYNNGYVNPMNIYNRLGYGSGESYPFGVRFILPGGDTTPTFPIMGMDMRNGLRPYPSGLSLDGLILQLERDHQGFRETDGANINGIVRFPNRNFAFHNGMLEIYGISMKIPEIPESVKKETIGIQFMRAQRNPDRITQGVFFNTMPVPVDDYIRKGVRGTNARKGWQLWDYEPGFSENTSKWIPVYDYKLESPAAWEDYANGGRSDEIRETGIMPVRFNLRNRAVNRTTMFAFVSPEIQAIASNIIGRINNREVTVVKRSKVVSKQDATTNAYRNNLTYSLLRNVQLVPEFGSFKGRTSWVVGGESGKNTDHYAGGAFFQARSGRYTYAEFNVAYNDYVGLTLTEGQQFLGAPAGVSGELAGEDVYETDGFKDHSILADIYPANGQRSTADLKRIYSNINSLSYFPISKRMYWDETIEDADPDISLENRLDSERRIVLFGGDTYVQPHYRRLYINNWGTFGQQNFMDREGRANLGTTMMYFAESSVNTAIRGEHTFDVSEYRMRTFYPFEALKKNFNRGDEHGNGHPWREYRLMETQDYDHGHRQNEFGRFSIAFPVDSPYIATRRRARIMHSAKFTASSFNNELRRWEGLNFVDYDPSLGKIIRLGVFADKVMIVQERGTSFIRLEERIAAGNSSGGPVFFESSGVLPPKATPISSMGSSWPESVLFTDIGVYGFDNESQYIWKYDYKVMKPVSKLSIDSHLQKYLRPLRNATYRPVSAVNVIATRDANNEEVNFSFLLPKDSFTVSYSEVIQEFTYFPQFVPETGFSLDSKYFTLKNGTGLYEHDRDDVPRGEFYGQQTRHKVSFVVNEQVDLNKVFLLLDIMSNRVFPDKITFRVPGAKSEETIVHQGKIYEVNARFLENKVAVSIPKIKEVTDNDATEYGLAEESNNISLADIGSRIRGRLMVVDLEYSEQKSLQLKSVLTYFNYC